MELIHWASGESLWLINWRKANVFNVTHWAWLRRPISNNMTHKLLLLGNKHFSVVGYVTDIVYLILASSFWQVVIRKKRGTGVSLYSSKVAIRKGATICNAAAFSSIAAGYTSRAGRPYDRLTLRWVWTAAWSTQVVLALTIDRSRLCKKPPRLMMTDYINCQQCICCCIIK